MKLILLTYSDDRFGRKDGKYFETQCFIDELLNLFSLDITHKKYCFDTIKNDEYIQENIDYFNLDMDRNGRAFKPYIIKKELALLEDDDILIYNDCSPEIWSTKNISNNSIEQIKKNTSIEVISNLLDINNDILLVWCPVNEHTHHNYTLDSCIKRMDAEKYRHSILPGSGLIFIKKTNKNIEIIDEWLFYNMIPECASLGINYENWKNEAHKKIGHRHDQSILSILLCKNNYKLIDPSNCHLFPIADNHWNFINYLQKNIEYILIDPNYYQHYRLICKKIQSYIT